MKKAIFFLIIIFSSMIINNMVHSIYNLLGKETLLKKEKNELTNQTKEHEKLKKQLAKVNSPVFVEGEARNKLLLVKKGEEPVFISKRVSATSEKGVQKDHKKPVWQQWLDLFAAGR